MALTFATPAGTKVDVGDAEPIVQELRTQPGEWALVCTAKKSAPDVRLCRAELRCFARLLEFDVRESGSDAKLYARWPLPNGVE